MSPLMPMADAELAAKSLLAINSKAFFKFALASILVFKAFASAAVFASVKLSIKIGLSLISFLSSFWSAVSNPTTFLTKSSTIFVFFSLSPDRTLFWFSRREDLLKPSKRRRPFPRRPFPWRHPWPYWRRRYRQRQRIRQKISFWKFESFLQLKVKKWAFWTITTRLAGRLTMRVNSRRSRWSVVLTSYQDDPRMEWNIAHLRCFISHLVW
mgnify:CR=1 FL=1